MLPGRGRVDVEGVQGVDVVGPQLVVAGAAETEEFKRQSDAYCERYRTPRRSMERYDVPDSNHFAELERLAEPDSEAFQRAMALLER